MSETNTTPTATAPCVSQCATPTMDPVAWEEALEQYNPCGCGCAECDDKWCESINEAYEKAFATMDYGKCKICCGAILPWPDQVGPSNMCHGCREAGYDGSTPVGTRDMWICRTIQELFRGRDGRYYLSEFYTRISQSPTFDVISEEYAGRIVADPIFVPEPSTEAAVIVARLKNPGVPPPLAATDPAEAADILGEVHNQHTSWRYYRTENSNGWLFRSWPSGAAISDRAIHHGRWHDDNLPRLLNDPEFTINRNIVTDDPVVLAWLAQHPADEVPAK
jgi:hypothetical protein